MQMVEVKVPTSDGRELEMSRYSQPDKDLKLLLTRMGLELPPQPPPRIGRVQAAEVATRAGVASEKRCGADLWASSRSPPGQRYLKPLES